MVTKYFLCTKEYTYDHYSPIDSMDELVRFYETESQYTSVWLRVFYYGNEGRIPWRVVKRVESAGQVNDTETPWYNLEAEVDEQLLGRKSPGE